MGKLTDWRTKGLYDADSDKVYFELKELGNATIDNILERAKDPNTELHKCFEWNDSIAADKYRRFQASQIRIQLVIKQQEGEKEYIPIRMINKASETEWKPIEIIIKNDKEYKYMLKRALLELQAFQKKYAALSEFEELFEIITQFVAGLD